jgi:hypothetical protein
MRNLLNIFFFLIILTAFDSHACSCFGKETIKQAYRTSDVVVSGEVVSIRKYNVIQEVFNGDTIEWYRKEVTIKVANNFKNGNSEHIVVYTGLGGGDCGFNFEIGKSYLLYANKGTEDGVERLRTNICTRTSEISTGTEELEKLKKLAKLE